MVFESVRQSKRDLRGNIVSLGGAGVDDLSVVLDDLLDQTCGRRQTNTKRVVSKWFEGRWSGCGVLDDSTYPYRAAR